ncbi:aromatic hydrocarbon degradation protein [Ectothiorhodospiraceae bacterium BW-2]|nr:aromatic hydrocarbon degradation protein [Ectothiorhodospiraceae bacterium BW-2]
MKQNKIAVAVALTLASSSSYATNGMSMEAFGPISAGLGGTAQAYNNGLGGMMNNPATMGMGAEEGNKIQFALSALQPDVSSKAEMGGMTFETASSGDRYLMPAFGYARKQSNGLLMGVGVIPQGGMGTEYGVATLPTDLFAGGMDMDADGPMGPDTAGQTMLSGQPIRSELGVGRAILPIGYQVNNRLNIAASLDYMWVGMDLQMDMDGQTFQNMAYNPQTGARTGLVTGTMMDGLEGALNPQSGSPMAGMMTDVNYARFDFSNSDDYTGQATADGFAAKLGMTYRISNQLSIGASYHTKSSLSDMTGSGTMTMGVDMMGPNPETGAMVAMENQTVPVKGTVTVEDFQWPASMALGVAFHANEKWMFTGDIKIIQWEDVMDAFRVGFTANQVQSDNPMDPANGFGGASIKVIMPQDWDDQVVTMLGAQYKPKPELALRGGISLSSNPIPDETMNPLFPAIVENHFSLGVGYAFNSSSLIDAAVTFAPEVEQTNSMNGVTTSHSQTNLQLMYTYRWGVKTQQLTDNY